MVGGADFIKTGEEEGEGAVNKAVIGDIIIVCAQVIMMLLMPMMRMMRRWRTDSCRRHHDHLHPANVACGMMVLVCLYVCWETISTIWKKITTWLPFPPPPHHHQCHHIKIHLTKMSQ